MDIGDRIKELREAQGLDQRRLAAEIGRSRVVVSAWETKRKRPGREALIALARRFNVPVEFLAGGDAGPSPLVVADPREAAVLALLREAPEATREAVLTLLKAAAGGRKDG